MMSLWKSVVLWISLQVFSQVRGAQKQRTCEHSVTGDSGSITSPGYPGNYPNDQDCVWLITVSKGRYVMLNFTFFDVEFYPGHSCIDMVEVKDGDSPKSELLGTFCSGISPPRYPIYSSGNNIRLWFYSDAADQRKGFTVEYKSFPETGCGGTLTTNQGVITSPRYGSASPYPSNIECEWTITVDKGKFIKLWFEDISIEMDPLKCFDRIELLDGPPNNETSLGIVCQEINPIFSKSNRLRLRFVTNKEGRHRGFLARYTTSLTTGCGGDYDSDSGTILSPNYPYSYPSMTECIWRIKAPEKKYISLRFNVFFGMNGTVKACPLDHVEIKDGYSKDSKSLGRFCSQNPPKVIVSSGNLMWIKFQSSLSLTPGKLSAVWLTHSRECNASLGMEDGRIDDTQLTASSYSNYFPQVYSKTQQWSLLPKYGRLNGAYAWCSQAQGRQMYVGEYFQIDFKGLAKITALATQGFVHQIVTRFAHVHIDAVSSYKVEFSFDENNGYWRAYSDGSDNSTRKGFTEFLGNYHTAGSVLNYLRPPIVAHMIRVMPIKYTNSQIGGHMCLRMEVYGCPYDTSCTKILSIDQPAKLTMRASRDKEKNCNYITKPTPARFKDVVLIWTFIIFDIPCNAGHMVMKHKSGESKKLCDNNHEPTYIMRASEQMEINVHLKKGSEDVWFDISYKTESLGCGEIIYVKRNGSIQSPRFPQNYGTELNCRWILIAPRSSARIGLNFKEFDLQEKNESSSCVDYVEIKEGPLAAQMPAVGRYCGNNIPLNFISQENSVVVEFHSDKKTTGKGFSLDYTYLPPKEQSQIKDLSMPHEPAQDQPLLRRSSATGMSVSWTVRVFVLLIFVLNIN